MESSITWLSWTLYILGSLECNGHEQVDDNPAAMTLYNITLDPFVASGKSHSQGIHSFFIILKCTYQCVFIIVLF